jgi:hypothetical protein
MVISSSTSCSCAHHSGLPRSRRSIAGPQCRPPVRGVWFHFPPLSVGFGPPDVMAFGALAMAPSMLCQLQVMPSMSSYSARPACHKGDKKSRPGPAQKMRMDCTGAPETLLGQYLPRTAGSEHIKNSFKNFSRGRRFSTTSSFALIVLVWVALRQWYQRGNFFPERIGDFPGLNSGHITSRQKGLLLKTVWQSHSRLYNVIFG